MNRGLLLFALFLVLVGYLSGLVVVLGLGVILVFPALLASSKKPAPPNPIGQARQSQQRRIQQTQPSPTAPQQAGGGLVVETMAGPRPSYSPDVSTAGALFPMPMFPSLSMPMGQYGVPSGLRPEPGPKEKQESGDELLELVAIMAFLKLASS